MGNIFADFVFTPKALNNKAQGQRRSRATLGYNSIKHTYAEGVLQFVDNAFGVKMV